MTDYRYPLLIGGMTSNGGLSWDVWAREQAGVREAWHLFWDAGSPHALIRVKTVQGDYLSLTPSTYEEVDRLGVEGRDDAIRALLAYARERLGVVDVRGV